ncbi:ShlB/FhaC/HecB family hemolysin secretion/activation protein [Raoultella ornithinolytica]|uniref:ShlB/FhaC/HecB family hemolysin secretion/activation protein n=1 Tax=Raoultella ornithinolytica TaxID=54291 RepID=UPI0009D6C1A0|nr:ShlB/FhaC/HecB family hemolysin secretion/activation protein [Raoultella ornithinolytica]
MLTLLPAARRLWFFVAPLLMPFTLFAAPLSPADQSAIEQQQKALLDHTQQQREALRNSTSIQLSPDKSLSVEKGPCFAIKQIRLLGSTALPRDAQKTLTSAPAKGCLSLQEIQLRVRDITQAYLSRGFITSHAWLPEQDISGGLLLIEVTEGKVESITLAGSQDNTLRMAFPQAEGRILNLRDLEQGLDQLNRLRSRALTIDVLPGNRDGFSRVDLIATDHHLPVSLSLGADNSGQKSTGSRQMNAQLTVDNPLSLADQWMLSAGRDSEFHHDRRSRNLQAGVTVPYGYWLFSAQYGWSDFYQTLSVGDSSSRWRYDGTVQTQRLAVSRTLWRDGKQRMALDMAFSRRETENRLGGVRLGVSSPTLTSVIAGLSYSRTLGNGYLTVGPSLSHGLSLAGATRDDPAHPELPRSEFRRFSLSASWFYPLTPSLYWLTSAYGQTTPDRLYASEQLSVGGQYSVRGYKEQYLSGNRGGYWRNELTWQWMTIPGVGTLSATGALDAGHVVSQKGITDGGTLAGTSLGLELAGRWLSQSLTVAMPLSYPDRLNPDKQVVYWQATVSL